MRRIKVNSTLGIVCVLYLVVIGIRWTYYLTPEFIASSSNGNILDTRFWYSIDQGYSVIEGFSHEAVRIYHEIFIWDMILPMVYCYLAILIFGIVPSLKRRFSFLPIIAMAFDYIENITLFFIISNRMVRHNKFMFIANISGTVKYIFQDITLVLVIIMLLIGIVKYIKRRDNIFKNYKIKENTIENG